MGHIEYIEQRIARMDQYLLQGLQPWQPQLRLLRTLPGIGPYTAAAIAAIAFDRPGNVVDGNVERVVTRLFALDEELPGAKPAIKALEGTKVRFVDDSVEDVDAIIYATGSTFGPVGPMAGREGADTSGQASGGLLAGTGTRMTGTVLEEGLRGAGGWLLDGQGQRFM